MIVVHTQHHILHATQSVHIEECPFDSEEVPARAELILTAVLEAGLGEVQAPADHGLEPILAVHDADFVHFLQTAYDESAACLGQEGPVFTWTFATRYTGRRPEGFIGLKGYYAFGWGSPILEGTWTAAYWSAQCALTAANLVQADEQVVYALCRPPGHHAAVDLYGGFCYLNNAAIAARWLQSQGRVAVLDVDYHHGNGTQAIFYSDPDVLYCSLHADPGHEYPYYWGYADEMGEGMGAGTNHNWPLPVGSGDAKYLDTLDQALAVVRDFGPSHLVISLGLDTLEGDPVGDFRLTMAGVRQVGERIAALGLPTVIVQEGGYLLDRLGEAAVAFLYPFAAGGG